MWILLIRLTIYTEENFSVNLDWLHPSSLSLPLFQHNSGRRPLPLGNCKTGNMKPTKKHKSSHVLNDGDYDSFKQYYIM